MKKTWSKPVLTVLLRGRPEENVLIACKTLTSGTTPGTIAQYCARRKNQSCTECHSRGGGLS